MSSLTVCQWTLETINPGISYAFCELLISNSTGMPLVGLTVTGSKTGSQSTKMLNP